jgi:hypothetical protein
MSKVPSGLSDVHDAVHGDERRSFHREKLQHRPRLPAANLTAD